MPKIINNMKIKNLTVNDTDTATSGSGSMSVTGGISCSKNIYINNEMTGTDLICDNLNASEKLNKKISTTSTSLNLDTESILNVTDTATITLPDITNASYNGVSYTVIKQTANTVTLTTQAADKIYNGVMDADSIVLSGASGEQVTVTSNGSAWITSGSDNAIVSVISSGGGTGGGLVTYGIQPNNNFPSQNASSASFKKFDPATIYTDVTGHFTTTTGSETDDSPRFTCNTAGTYEFQFLYTVRQYKATTTGYGSVNTIIDGGNIHITKTLSGNTPTPSGTNPNQENWYESFGLQTYANEYNAVATNISIALTYELNMINKVIFTLAAGDMINIWGQTSGNYSTLATANHRVFIYKI